CATDQHRRSQRDAAAAGAGRRAVVRETRRMARIVVTGRIPSSAHDLLERAHPGHVRVFAGDPPSVDELAAELTDAEALVAVWYPVRRELLERAPRLKVVANTAVGFDNIDVAECARRGVT